MSDIEPDPLANVELAVITAPRAPAGFAAGVLARFATTEAAIAVSKRRRVRRAIWIATATATAAAAAIAAFVMWPRAAHTGAYVAAAPHHLDVGGVGVDLERGASLTWTVDHDRLSVDQRGGATWTVPADHHLRVEVAGVGAVEATNATLHVEARMNLLDGNMIAATVTTAALVTALTATVIQGRAEIEGSRAGSTVTIEVGRSAAVSPTGQPIVASNEAELARVDKTLQTVESLVKLTPVAVEIVFCGNPKWMDNELPAVESAIDHIRLPTGSTIGAVAYTAGNTTIQTADAPSARFADDWPKFVDRFHKDTAGDLVKGVQMGFGQARNAPAGRRVLLIIGDGNDSQNATAKVALADIQRTARAAGVEIRAVLTPGGAVGATTVEQAGIATVDASKVGLTHALAETMHGTILTPPKAVMVVFEAGQRWPTADVLAALGEGLGHADLPRGSRIGAVAFSSDASIQIPLESVTSFAASQLGTARNYPVKHGADVMMGVTLAAGELVKAPETDKLLVVIGNFDDFADQEVALVLNDVPGIYRNQGIEFRAIHFGPGASASVIDWFDPKPHRVVGKSNPGTLEQLRSAVHDVVR